MRKLLSLAVAGGLLASSPLALAAGDAAAGQAKAAMCGACHGMDGNSPNPEWPSLAGQHASYIVKQLREFKDGTRPSATMAGMAAALDEQSMEDIAAYFAGQTRTPRAADPELVEQGEALFRGGNLGSGVAACSACHGPDGGGIPQAAFPALAGQHAAYNEAQLRAFRSGERANDPGQMMRDVAARLTDAEIRAVASYMQGLE